MRVTNRWGPKLLSLVTVMILLLTPAPQPGPARAIDGSHVLITAVYYDTRISGEPDEAVQLHNPTGGDVDLSGWTICNDNGYCAALPAGAVIAAGDSLWIAREADDFTAEWTFAPAFEMVETDAAVPNTTGDAPVFANSGEAVYLKDASGAIVDMVVYGTGAPAPGDPWTGGPVPAVSAGQLIHRAFDEALLDGSGTLHYVTDTDSAADWHQGDDWRTTRAFRRGQPFLGLPVWTVSGNVTAYTTPDSTYPVLAGLIDGATSTIDMQVYYFQSYQLYERVAAALDRGVQVRLYLEGNPVGGMADQTKWIATELTKKGAEVMLITSSTGGYKRFNFTHSKFGIIDGQKVFIQSENPKYNGTPVDPSYGNRGWGVVVEAPEVVAYFQDVFETDWNPASPDTHLCQATGDNLCNPPAGFVPDQTIPTGTYPHPYDSHTFTGTFTMMPVMAPDHALLESRAIRKALASATKEILVEHMYLYKYWGDTTCNETDCPNLYLQDLIDAARRGVRVRVTLGAAFVDPTNPRDNTYTVAMLNSIAASEGLDMEARLENLDVNGLEKIHNKGFIIDGEKVLISSVNGSENSPVNNREAGILIESPAVAEFYRDVWHWNWHMGKDENGNAQPRKEPVISEVMYDPAGTESAEEWVEIYNPTAAAIDLTGWSLADNAGSWTFPDGTILGAGETLTVARDAAGFQALYGFAPDVDGLTLSLANSADYLLLVDPKGNAISKVAWGGSKPNWSLSTVEATTLARCPADQEQFNRLDWLTGAAPTPDAIPTECGGSGNGGGTGGSLDHLVVTEVFYDTPGTDSAEEWVEIYNGTGADVDLSGWTLQDNSGSWSFPGGTTIADGQFLVVARDAAGFRALYGSDPDLSGLSLALGNSGDVIRLVDGSGAEVDMVAWEGYVSGWSLAAATGESLHRSPVTADTDLADDWTVLADETPGAGQ